MRLMLRVLFGAVLMGATATATAGAAGGGEVPGCDPIAVDTGETRQQAAGQDEAGKPVEVASTKSGAGILGGERDIVVSDVHGKLGSEGVQVQFRRIGGELAASWSDDVLHNMVGTVIYDGIDGDAAVLNPTGLGGLDLTGSGALASFVFVIERLDAPGAPGPTLVPATMEVYTDSANASRLSLDIEGPVPVDESAQYVFPLADFNPFLGAGADWSNVGAISLQLNTGLGGLDAVDVLLTGFSGPCTGPPPGAPEAPPGPPTLTPPNIPPSAPPAVPIPPRFTG
jgi:hypothetical protein